jgi:MSHA pilin protein MshD
MNVRIRRADRGVTLIELVVTITVITIAVTAIVGALASSEVQGANRMIQQQATAVASSYLEEIMQKPFNDPNVNGETARGLFDDIGDYNGLSDSGARDQQGNPITGLEAYQVSVQVIGGTLTGIPAGAARLISVTVRHSTGLTVAVSGYKTNHPP